MRFLHEPIEYNEDGSVKQILNDIWVYNHEQKYLRIPVIPKTPGWAYIEESIDTPSYEIIEYRNSGYFSKNWYSYSRIK